MNDNEEPSAASAGSQPIQGKRNMGKKPIAWELIEKCSGNVLRRSSNAVLVAGWRRIIGATVVPVFRTRTNVQR